MFSIQISLIQYTQGLQANIQYSQMLSSVSLTSALLGSNKMTSGEAHTHIHARRHTHFSSTYILFKVLFTTKSLKCLCRPGFAQQHGASCLKGSSQSTGEAAGKSWTGCSKYRV